MITTAASRKGFTLVEMAIVMAIVGILVGLGSAMIGPLMSLSKTRETKEFLGGAVESVNSWAASNNRIPMLGDDVPDAITDEFVEVAKTPVDAWGRRLIYLYDANLYSATPNKDTICGRKTTPITLSNLAFTPPQSINNVAFIVLSLGDDALPNSRLTGKFTAAIPSPAVDLTNALITNSGSVAATAPATTATITLDANVSDIVRWVTLDELRSKIGCQGAQLKIVNNELPYGYENTKYVSKLYIDGGVSGYKWCINNLPTNLTFVPINSTTGAKSTAITSCTIPTDCSSLATNTGWVDAAAPIFMNISGVPTTRGSYQINVMAHDSNSTTLSQTNCTSKTFVLTINP